MENPQQTLSPLLIATLNQGKVHELRNMLVGFSGELRSLQDFANVVEVEEVGSTFEENAILKARGYADQTGLITLADDSGLEVDGLGGAPGVLSARYGGVNASDVDRITKLLSELSRSGDTQRRARFVCVLAVFDLQRDTLETFEGRCEGRIAFEPHGSQGFGYDPIFIPDGYAESFGCLPSAVKHQISHRGRAIRAASSYLQSLFNKPA